MSAAALVGAAMTLLKRLAAQYHPHTVPQHPPHLSICSVACRHVFSGRYPMGLVLPKGSGEQMSAAGLVGAAMTLLKRPVA